MRLYVDRLLNAIVSAPGSQNPVTRLEFKRGDSATIQVVFCEGTTVVELDSGATGIFGLKEYGKYDSDFVVVDEDWTKTGTGTSTVYSFTPAFNTTELNALLEVNADPEDDVASIELMGEIQWTISGAIASTQTFIAQVHNDVIRGDEDTPTALPTPDDDWVAHGHPQSLTDPQKAQARTNIGAAGLASPAFTGVPTAPTAAEGTSTTQLATTAFVRQEIERIDYDEEATSETVPIRDSDARVRAAGFRSPVFGSLAVTYHRQVMAFATSAASVSFQLENEAGVASGGFIFSYDESNAATIDFSGNTAPRTYTAPDRAGTLALAEQLSELTVEVITATTRTLTNADAGKMLVFDNACTVSATVSALASTFNVGIVARGGIVTLEAAGLLNGVSNGTGEIPEGYDPTSIFKAGSELIATGSIGTIA